MQTWWSGCAGTSRGPPRRWWPCTATASIVWRSASRATTRMPRRSCRTPSGPWFGRSTRSGVNRPSAPGSTGSSPMPPTRSFATGQVDVAKSRSMRCCRRSTRTASAGVSSSSGEVPTTFEQMGANAIAFIKALGLKQVDLFGFSIGGMVVQEITLQAPDLVRRLIVDGAGPRGGQGMELIAQATGRLFGAHPHDPPESVWLAVKFSPSAAGQAAGREYLKRTHRRQEGRDPEVNDKVSAAQVEAIGKWGVQQKGASDYLKTIKQPTLIVNGSNDVNIPTVNSFIMQQNMPNAQLIIYPDSNHGAHHQYPELFVEHATLFLNAVTTTKEGCTHG